MPRRRRGSRAAPACERAHDEVPKPTPRDARVDGRVDAARESDAPTATNFTIVYAARIDAAPDGTNGTYYCVVEDEEFFVLADARDPKSAELAATWMSELVANACHGAVDVDARQMRCVVDGANQRLEREHRTTSMAALIVSGRRALLARRGTVPAVWRHGSNLEVFDGRSAELGASMAYATEPRWIDLQPTDTIVLLNQRFLDAIGPEGVRSAAPDHEVHADALAAAARTLAGAGQRVGKRDVPLAAVMAHLIMRDRPR